MESTHPLNRLAPSASAEFNMIKDDAVSMTKPVLSPPAKGLYRPDIDGMRAFAVLSVVLYHAFPNEVRGCFVGVDIFFVISGFLISSILFAEITEHRFSLCICIRIWNFNRARNLHRTVRSVRGLRCRSFVQSNNWRATRLFTAQVGRPNVG